MEDNKKENVAVVSFLKKLKHDLLRYVIVFVVALVGSILVILRMKIFVLFCVWRHLTTLVSVKQFPCSLAFSSLLYRTLMTSLFHVLPLC